MGGLLQDVRYMLRQLRKNPGFTAVAVLSLALGIGANTAIFQFIDALWLCLLPVPNPERLAEVRIRDMEGVRGSQNRPNALTYRIWEQIRQRQGVFSGVFAWSDGQLNLSPQGE